MADAAVPRIGHLTGRYLPRSATFIYTLLRNQRTTEPIVLARSVENLDEFPFPRIAVLRPPGAARRAVNVVRARMSGIPDTLDWAIVRSARAAGCAALHAHFGNNGWMALEARRRLGIPLVTTFYGFDVGIGRTDPLWIERYKRLFDEGDAFVCEGPAMAEQLVEIGCPRERIHVVRIGLEMDRLEWRPRTRGRPLRILQVARFVEKKGLDLSIRAFAAARPALGESALVLVGDGPEAESLRALAADLGVADSVRFAGSLSQAEYHEILAGAHIGIQPSRTASNGDTEGGAPTVLIEYQASGLPVVATRHADIPFVVADPDLLADENDVEGIAAALVAVARQSDDEWRARASRAREFVAERHDAARVADAMSSVYSAVLGGGQDGPAADADLAVGEAEPRTRR